MIMVFTTSIPARSSGPHGCDHAEVFRIVPPDAGTLPMPEKFFDEQTEQSEVKAALVAKYFPAYMRVIGSAQRQYGGDRIAYIDLFAGPGRYKDGAQSTPVKIIEQAIADPDMRQRLVGEFRAGWPQGIAPLGLPQIRTCTFAHTAPHIMSSLRDGSLSESALRLVPDAATVGVSCTRLWVSMHPPCFPPTVS